MVQPPDTPCRTPAGIRNARCSRTAARWCVSPTSSAGELPRRRIAWHSSSPAGQPPPMPTSTSTRTGWRKRCSVRVSRRGTESPTSVPTVRSSSRSSTGREGPGHRVRDRQPARSTRGVGHPRRLRAHRRRARTGRGGTAGRRGGGAVGAESRRVGAGRRRDGLPGLARGPRAARPAPTPTPRRS